MKLASPKQIAEFCDRDISNINRTYFNTEKPKNINIGNAIETGTYLFINNISKEEIMFMVEFMKKHKELIRSKI